jgi:hypothetical protein
MTSETILPTMTAPETPPDPETSIDTEETTSAPGWIRTTDTRFRKPVLYPLSYGGVRARVALAWA